MNNARVVMTVESCGLDKISFKETVDGKLKRELEIDLANIPAKRLFSSIGSLVLGRIGHRLAGAFSGDFEANSYKFAEAMAETNHPELLYYGYLSALARATRSNDVAALDVAESFLKRAAQRGHAEASAKLVDWTSFKKMQLDWIKSRSQPDES